MSPVPAAEREGDYSIQDLDGYALTFGHRLPSREPAVEIERADVPVRLERRLAVVLADVAVRKQPAQLEEREPAPIILLDGAYSSRPELADVTLVDSNRAWR
jgi:hypothetical protein